MIFFFNFFVLQSHVRVSFEMAEYTAEVAGIGALRQRNIWQINQGLNDFSYSSYTEF